MLGAAWLNCCLLGVHIAIKRYTPKRGLTIALGFHIAKKKVYTKARLTIALGIHIAKKRYTPKLKTAKKQGVTRPSDSGPLRKMVPKKGTALP